MSGDKFDQLYNALKADGAVSGTRENFKKFVYAPGKQGYQNRKQLYDALHADGAVSSGSYEEFAQRLGLHATRPQKQAQAPKQPQQAQQKPQTAAQMAMSMVQPQQSQEPVDYLSRPQSQRGKAQSGAPKNASPFVQSLYEEDDAKKGADYPVSYSSPKGMQQVYEHNQQARKQATKTAADKIANDELRRQAQPIMQTDTPADTYIGKTQGQLEDEVQQSASRFVDTNLGDFVSKAVFDEQNAASERALAAADRVPTPAGGAGGMSLMVKGMAYNKEVDPDLMAKNLSAGLENKMQDIFSNPEFAKKIQDEAAHLGVSPEAYTSSLIPSLQNKLVSSLNESEFQKALPKNMLDNVANRIINSNTVGKLLRLATQSKGQRMMNEQAMAATETGENPYYKGGMVENVTSDIAGMAFDPIFGASAKIGGAVAGKILGNSTKIGALMANGNLAQRIGIGSVQAVTSGGVTGLVFDSTSSVVQNFSTGEDTSLGNTLNVALKGGLRGAANFATMSLAGVPLGQVGRSIGLKATNGGSFWGNTGRVVGKLGLESGKTYMEAMGMYLGGYVSGKMEGATDANGKPIEFDLWNGTMESLPTAVGFRIQHAIGGLKGGRKNEKGEDLGWLGSTAANLREFFTSDKAKVSRFVMTEDERKQIMASYHDTMGYNIFDNVVSVAKNAKKKPKTMRGANYDDVKFEEQPTRLADVESDMEVVRNVYDKIMADPNVSWDAKAKFSAMTTGIMPSARPMADHYRFESFLGTTYMMEYAANGELLSKRSYKNPTERDAELFKSKVTGENLRLHNSTALMVAMDRNNAETQDAFFQQKRKEGLSEQEIVQGMSDTESEIFKEFTHFCLENGSFMEDVKRSAAINDVSVEFVLDEIAKDPMKRTELGQDICTNLRQSIEATIYSKDKIHEEQSHLQGKDVAEDNGLGTEKPNGEAVKAELNNLSEAENELEQFIKDNDVFGQNFENLQKQGLTNPQIYAWMLDNGLTQEQLAPFAHYINANARVQGMQNATQQKIEEKVSAYVQDWSHHGKFNGQDAKGEQVVYVKDKDGRTLVVGSGDMAFDSVNGRAKEGVGDMLVCIDPNSGELVYAKAEDVTFFQTRKPEDFGNEYRQRLQSINAQAYNEAAAEQAAKNQNKPGAKGGPQNAPQNNVSSENQEVKSDQASGKNEEGIATNPTSASHDVEGSELAAPYDSGGKGTKVVSNEQDFAKETNSPEKISEEKDEWGKPLVKASDGSVNYGEIGDGYGLQAAPIRLSLGENRKNPETGKDEGYGLLHIIARHGDQIRKAGYKSVQEFVEAVSKGYTEIREGVQIGDTQTYLIVKKDGHANTLYIELSRDGKYWNVNSAGIFKEKYVNRKNEIKPEPTVGSSTSTDTTGVNHGQSEGAAVASGNSPMISHGKDTNNSSNGNASEATLTFKDGNPVPMTTDSKGRPTPDYGKMTAEQAAEVMTQQFGEDAEKVADAQIKKAEKVVKTAEKMKVDYGAEPNDILEQKQVKDATIAAAKEQLEKAEAIKKAMTAQKVAETMKPKENEGADDKGEANTASSTVAAKFQNATRLQGRTRTRTLSDGTKVNGHYEIVPAESLTPSHDVFNGYKKSEGFPVDAEGRTINDRDYEHDKKAQEDTDLAAGKYDGQAIDHIPTVSDEGIVYDGNGRTMAGQKAAKDGTDGEYLNALYENAEMYGFTKEQIAESGIEHPRLVLVTNERLPYDTETFAKFNKNERKTQSNTEKAVTRAKTLSSDEIGSIVAEVEGSGSLEAFFKNPKAINDLINTLQNKGVLAHNEIAELLDGEGVLSAQGKEYVKNLLLGSVFTPDTIRMMGIDSAIKTKAISGIRAIIENAKLGDYALRDEIDNAIKLLYEARRNGSTVDDLLKQSSAFDENARDRFSPIEQALAQSLEGSGTTLFRDLMREYNDIAKNYNTGESDMFGEHLSPEELVKQFLEVSKTIKNNNFKLYGNETERRNSEQEGGDHAASHEEPAKEAGGAVGTEGNEPAESQDRVTEALKHIATEITKQTGVEVVTDEKAGQSALEDAEATDSNIKYHKETDQDVLNELNNGETIKVYRAMQVIDGKLYPPMAASVGGKLVEANELGTWIRADENPDLAIPDIDPKTGQQKVDKKTGELKWKFKLDKGGKDATGKKATDVNAAYNPYWHMSRSPLNDQFKSAWIRPNIVVVECEVPVSELTSGYRAERAKDAVGEVDWKSGSVSGEVFKQTGRARKVILSRWCKPVRVLEDAEVAQRAKEFVGEAKVEIPENVLTPKQRIAFEEAGFKIGAPEKGVKKSEQIQEALEKGLQIDNAVIGDRKEFRGKDGEVYGFTDGEKIYLDTKKMKPETPLHEYTHLWTAALKRANPKEWENVKKLFDEVEGLKEEVSKLYPELKGDDLYEEMITTYSGREGAKKLEEVVRELAANAGDSVENAAKSKTFIEKVKTALKTYWKGVADMLHIHFTSAEEVADKVLADWAKGVNPKDVKGEEKPELPKDPIEGLNKAAEGYNESKLDTARKAYAEAKESGDESEIKRTRDDLKQKLDDKYKAQGMDLATRQKEIAKEIGEAEAEKIDKPWEQMDLEEREAVSSKNPLTEDEINELTSEENRELIPAALAYLRGDKGNIVNAISYFKIWNDVRNRHENAPDHSGAGDGTQLAAADTTGGEGLGLGTGRDSRGVDGQLDRGTGDEPSSRERTGGESGETNPAVPTGEPSDKQGEGKSSDVGAVPVRDTDTQGGSAAGTDGNKPQRGGRKGGNRPAKSDAKRKPAAKQGTHFPNSTAEQLKQEREAHEKQKADFWARWKKAGQGYVKIALTPFKKLNLTPGQIEMLPELLKMHLNGAVLKIKEGIFKFKEWKAAMMDEAGKELKMIGLTDEDVDRFIDDYWNTPFEMDGESHTIGEWAGIYGNEKVREKLKAPLNEKYQKQMAAEPIKVKVGDRKNIEETLPFLLPQQQEDVLRAETQFFGGEHSDRDHAYGKGYMFTNGTGTGKTYTGLGIAKRLAKQGKGRILFVTPSQPKVKDWIKDAKNLGLDIRDLESWAEERGTTATTESGEGMVITTYANMRQNKKLLETEWDAVFYDESHRIMENKKGAETTGSQQHYMLTNRDENHAFLRLQSINKHYQKIQSALDKFNAQRQKEIERIQKEYRQSHPSATAKDVVNATHSKLPKDIYSFAPADGMTFPKLGKAYQDFQEAKAHYYNNVEPKLKEQAKQTWKNTKTVFLSATPFNTRENLDYAEGYIFKYPEEDPNSRMSSRSRFYLDHFGAAYRYRYNRLESKTDNPDAVAKQEVAFSDYLQNTLGTMSGRIIDSPYDYSRDFPTVAPDHAEDFNAATQEAMTGRYLGEAYRKTIGNYNYGSALFETMKIANIIGRMKEHLDAGRKIVVFHRRVETKEPIQPPFAYMLSYANAMIKDMKPGKEKEEAIAEANEFRRKYADLLQWEQTLDYSMPREQIAKAFGKDNVLFFSGKEAKGAKSKAVDIFNDDNSGKNIIVIQEASGKEGISLHDTTGNHQRVLITLALPQSPITALQVEGRTYRIGNKSNAIFEYPILGLNSEMMLFGEKFNNQVSTTENLALGSQARSLRESFANGVLEHSGIVPIDQQGVGGKEFDAPKQSDTDPFDDAVLDYYSNQKLNKRNREGQDYFPTPEPLGYKMVEWANMGEGDTALEPSAGHGAIARYIPRENQLLSIEPSQSLFTKLQLKAGGLGRKFLNNMFENYDVSNKHDVVVMNPPFGTAGATAIAHLDKAFKHLDEGGRVVAIIPRGSTDKKFDKWYDGQKNVAMRAEVDLPDIVFQQAGTSVRCRVVVLDKITDAALRSKAGYPEKIDLSGHYDKIEDFFEDLRDVQIPDRIVDTQLKDMKKARSFKKELDGIKGIRVNYFEKSGISVFDKNTYNDYSIAFPGGVYSKERLRSNYADKYEEFTQWQNRSYNENSKAALEEMKKLACKLADMSEDEMQKYISDRKNNGTHFREDRGVQYSKTDAKDVKKGRIIPEDVDKAVSSQIEKKFDDAVKEASSNLSAKDKEYFDQEVEANISAYSTARTSVIENSLKDYEYDFRRWRDSATGGNGGETFSGTRAKIEYYAAKAAAERELDYRKVRADYLRATYDLQAGRPASLDTLERLFKDVDQGEGTEERAALFGRAKDIVKRLGGEFNIFGEPSIGGRKGESGTDREMGLYLDMLTNTYSGNGELATTILHEMIHQATMGSINLVNKGMAEGMLTSKQIEAVNTILGIYDRVKNDKERFKEQPYGLNDEYELTAQMADPRQRKAMDLSIWDRVVNAAHEFARKGDRSVLERVKGAVKKLFEVSDKDKMDKAINDIMDDFNETVDDISMNEIEKDGFASSSVKLSDHAPIVMKHIAKVAEKVGGKVNMVQSPEEITNSQAKAAIEAGKPVTGWYDEKTGEVHLYMPNIHDRYTAEKTIWHEVVGHKGMRELFGEDRFDKFLRSIWYDLDKPENASLKKLVMEEMQKNPLNIYDAIEEGVARLAEEGRGDAGFWRNIKNKVVDFLHEIGYRVAPNTKDVKYLLWLSKNLQKNPNDPYYKMRAEAVKYHIDHEDVPVVTERDGMFHDNTGRTYHDMSEMPKAEYQEMTDGKVHFRTTPSAGTAIDRYNRALNAHGYMATESYMDNMLSLKELMKAVDPSIKKIEDVKSSENPYMLQNTMQGAMSDAAQMFERNVMQPLDKAMAGVLDAFDGKKDEEKIRNFNLYMITKHGLERNRVFFVRDHINNMDKADADILQKQWDAEKKDLGDKLRKGQIRLDEYYKDMDEWIRNNVDKDFDASEHDYSGMHGLQEIGDTKAPYDDAAAIQSVMDSEASMESIKAGSVKDFWSKVNQATSYSLYCDYANGFQNLETYTKTSQMFDWYVPLRKFDEATAEDVYGYVTEKGDPSGYIGSVLMSAKGRKSLSEVNVLAQIGAMGNMAISNGGKNAVKQAFMRFARSHDSQGLITEGQVWLVKDGTNADGSDRWVEAYPQIPDGADPNTTSTIINKFEADMKAKQATGDAKIMRNAADIGYKFERAKDKSQHVVDVKVNGKTCRFYINGNPRAAQALNGMLENKGSKYLKPLSSITRTMAQLCTSYSPEFVVRNIVRDAQFASSNVTAKEGAGYRATWAKYYAKMLPIGAKNISIKDISGSTGLGLYAKYRNGTLDMNNKIHKYFKEFMENGGETGWVQVLSMKEWEKKYKRDIKTERSKLDKGGKAVKDFFFGNLENLNEAAENMARFATYCTSRDYGRSTVRSAYDAKEVSTNFNRHGSGDAIWSFKNGEMSGFQKGRRNAYGFVASYLRQCSMFFNAGIQSTNLLKQNVKAAPKGTITAMMGIPFILGASAALLNNWMIANEDEKDRNGVKDPYAELPDYIRRNDLCIYKGGGEFITIPLAIELRAFYGLGDLAIGMTFADNIKSTRQPWMDAVGCVSQLVPVMDYTNSHAVDKDPINETVKAFAPSAISPFVEWGLNSDWKGAPIRRETTSYNKYAPAWQRAYKNTPQMFMQLNKKVNAMTNDVAPGNEDMLGNGFLDAVTNPAGLNHYFGGFGGGAATFGTRVAKLFMADKVETNDIPFLRSFLYKPNEQSSMQRTKSKWYNYVEGMEKTMSNLDRLKSKNVPIDKRLENIGAYYKFRDSKEAQAVDIIERAQEYMKKWKQMRDKSSDATAIDNANKNIDLIMQEAVEQLDKLQ